MNNNYPQTFNTIGQCSISIEKVYEEVDWSFVYGTKVPTST